MKSWVMSELMPAIHPSLSTTVVHPEMFTRFDMEVDG